MPWIVCGNPKISLGYSAYVKSKYFALPIYEGYILPNNYKGEWAGFDACPLCHYMFQNIEEPMELEDAREIIYTWLSIIFKPRSNVKKEWGDE